MWGSFSSSIMLSGNLVPSIFQLGHGPSHNHKMAAQSPVSGQDFIERGFLNLAY